MRGQMSCTGKRRPRTLFRWSVLREATKPTPTSGATLSKRFTSHCGAALRVSMENARCELGLSRGSQHGDIACAARAENKAQHGEP